MSQKNISIFNNYILWFIIIMSLIILYIFNIIYDNYDSYKYILDKWYDYQLFKEIILNNINYLISFIFWYLVLIWLIWSKKWLISLTNYNSHYKIITYIYRWLWFLSMAFWIYLFKKCNYSELIILIINSWFSFFIWTFLLSYVRNLQDNESLTFVNDIKNKENGIYKNIYKFFTVLLDYYIWVILIIAFLIFPIWIYLNFNIFTIIYIHLTLIISYSWLNILNNRFPPIVNIWYNGKIYRNYYLAENTKEKIIITNNKHSLVLKPEKMDFIETKKN